MVKSAVKGRREKKATGRNEHIFGEQICACGYGSKKVQYVGLNEKRLNPWEKVRPMIIKPFLKDQETRDYDYFAGDDI